MSHKNCFIFESGLFINKFIQQVSFHIKRILFNNEYTGYPSYAYCTDIPVQDGIV